MASSVLLLPPPPQPPPLLLFLLLHLNQEVQGIDFEKFSNIYLIEHRNVHL